MRERDRRDGGEEGRGCVGERSGAIGFGENERGEFGCHNLVFGFRGVFFLRLIRGIMDICRIFLGCRGILDWCGGRRRNWVLERPKVPLMCAADILLPSVTSNDYKPWVADTLEADMLAHGLDDGVLPLDGDFAFPFAADGVGDFPGEFAHLLALYDIEVDGGSIEDGFDVVAEVFTGGGDGVAGGGGEEDCDFAGEGVGREGLVREVFDEVNVFLFALFDLVAVVVDGADEGAGDGEEDGPIAGGKFGAETSEAFWVG